MNLDMTMTADINRRVLILGGRGFIGHALAPVLRSAGMEVVLAGRGDDLEALLSGCQAVVHLACSTTPSSSREHPAQEAENIATTLGLLEALQHHPGSHLIFLSSGGAIYGNPASLPVPEDAPLSPLSWHAAGKAAVETLLSAHKAGPVTVLRVANAYGPGQPEKPGFGFIRAVLECARSGRSLEIWGNGETVRDFVFIDDVTSAIVAALNHPNRPGSYNVGSSQGHSLNEVVALARSITAQPIEVHYHPSRETDVRAVVLEITRARQHLDWRPRFELAEGLRLTWERARGQP